MAGAGYKLFTTGSVLTAAEVNTYLMEQTIMVFNNAAARDTALTGVLAQGMQCFLKDTNTMQYYSGSAWVTLSTGGDITSVTAGTGISGGGTSGDVTITNSMATAIDAKGDLVAGTADNTFARLAVGNNGETLVADSSTATGLKWQAQTVNTVVDAKGDLIVGTANDTVSRLPVGTNNTLLIADSTTATGLRWGTISTTPTGVGCFAFINAAQTISNATVTVVNFNSEEFDTNGFHDNVTNNNRLTVPSGYAGYYLISGTARWTGNATSYRNVFIRDNIGNNLGSNMIPNTGNAIAFNHQIVTVRYLAVGDWVEFLVEQNSGGSLNINSGRSGTSFSMMYLGA